MAGKGLRAGLASDQSVQVMPRVGDLREGVQSQPLPLLADLRSAQGLVEEPRAVGLEDPEIEPEAAAAHEVAGAFAHERAAGALALARLDHVERVDLALEAFQAVAR